MTGTGNEFAEVVNVLLGISSESVSVCVCVHMWQERFDTPLSNGLTKVCRGVR